MISLGTTSRNVASHPYLARQKRSRSSPGHQQSKDYTPTLQDRSDQGVHQAVNSQRTTPLPCKTEAIKEFTRPSTVKGLHPYLARQKRSRSSPGRQQSKDYTPTLQDRSDQGVHQAVNSQRTTPLPCKTAVIKEFTRPSTVKGLHPYLARQP